MSEIKRDHEAYMRLALLQAEVAYDLGEVPVGALIVHDDQIIAKSHNQVESLKDATAHAEILAITQASAAIGDWRLNDATLYVTKEPCAMCAGAMVNSRLARVVFGVSDSRYGAAGGALDVTNFVGHLHHVDVVSGVLRDDCLLLLQSFFEKARRDKG